MKLIKTDNFPQYRYCVVVDSKNRHPVKDVVIWMDELAVDCIIAPGKSYFRTEQDALLFILKWSQ